MNTKLEALIAAYQVKPKKIRKKPLKGLQKSPQSNKAKISNAISINSLVSNTIPNKKNRENYSVPPKRSESNLSLSRYLNSSLDEDMEKLDNLTVKNSSARLDWISVKQRMIEISVKKKLNPIEEIDESGNDFITNQIMNPQYSKDLISKYESRINLSLKDRIRSLDNLLLVD